MSCVGTAGTLPAAPAVPVPAELTVPVLSVPGLGGRLLGAGEPPAAHGGRGDADAARAVPLPSPGAGSDPGAAVNAAAGSAEPPRTGHRGRAATASVRTGGRRGARLSCVGGPGGEGCYGVGGGESGRFPRPGRRRGCSWRAGEGPLGQKRGTALTAAVGADNVNGTVWKAWLLTWSANEQLHKTGTLLMAG